ncbi:hypothetical protein D5086_000519 [Populus alba]|uniref:Uncharacterized protein n=1 Tax=Populus alba TaxID=43335 RepID=A0ACC4CWU1_POPAL
MSSPSIHVIYVALVGSGIQMAVCACMCLSRGTQKLFVVIDQMDKGLGFGLVWTRSPMPLLTVFVLRSSKLEGEGGQLLIKRGWMSTLLDYDAVAMKVRLSYEKRGCCKAALPC